MRRKLILAAVVALFLLSSSSAVAVEGCSYSCRTGIDEKGDAFAHCIQWLSGRRGNMVSCLETQNCWRAINGQYCDPPSCAGQYCYDV